MGLYYHILTWVIIIFTSQMYDPHLTFAKTIRRAVNNLIKFFKSYQYLPRHSAKFHHKMLSIPTFYKKRETNYTKIWLITKRLKGNIVDLRGSVANFQKLVFPFKTVNYSTIFLEQLRVMLDRNFASQ